MRSTTIGWDARSGALFRADQASMLTKLMCQAISTFGLSLDELHNDATTLSMQGAYSSSVGDSDCVEHQSWHARRRRQWGWRRRASPRRRVLPRQDRCGPLARGRRPCRRARRAWLRRGRQRRAPPRRRLVSLRPSPRRPAPTHRPATSRSPAQSPLGSPVFDSVTLAPVATDGRHRALVMRTTGRLE